jgi:hypothetical protein
MNFQERMLGGMKWVKENNIELLEGGRNRKKMNKNIYFYEKI